MKILGIDPGYGRLGIAVIEKTAKQKETVLYSACFSTSKKETIYWRLNEIGKEVVRVMDKFKPTAVALETLFITKNQKTAMRVAEARGIIIYEGIKRDLRIFEYSPMEIKMAITGDGTSDKTRMKKMVHLLVKMPAKKLDDEYDAIAVALTCSTRIK
ncbi:MAG: crossover junction endodeoxyribonuclease RuvC [Patescibacteria group bacterium]